MTMSVTNLFRGIAVGMLAILGGFSIVQSAEAGKRAFTIEDLYRVKTLSHLTLSPDGRFLAFDLDVKDFGKGKSNKDLYWVSTRGGEPRRLTFTENQAETAPAWSPDGKQLAFISVRDGKPGIWLLPVDGGEARLLISVASGVSDIRWSPDGRNIAFISTVHPRCGADDECNQMRDRWREKGPLRAHVAGELLYRHWTTWYDGKVDHILIVNVASGKVRDLTPGENEAPVFNQGKDGFAFSLDGKELAYTRNPDPIDRLATSTNSDIWIIPVDPAPDGSTPMAQNITGGNPAYDGAPCYSPDGKKIAFLRQRIPGNESDRFSLYLYDRQTRETRELTPRFDNWIRRPEWLPDSKGLLFKADEKGQTPIYRIGLEGGDPTKVAEKAFLDEYVVGSDGREVFAIQRAVHAPYELFRFDLSGKDGPRQLTSFNKQLEEEVDLRPAWSAWVDGANGAKIHTFLIKPFNFDPAKKYPVIINIHGGPQMMWADSFRGDWQIYPGAGYVVVFPNPHGSTGYGQAFTDAISGDYTGAVMEDIAKVTDWVESLPYVDKDRIGVMGWSWGGYAVNWLLGTTTRYKAMASMMGIFDTRSFYGGTEELWFPEQDFRGTPWTSEQYEKVNPSKNWKNFKTPTLFITGELDFRIPYPQSLMGFTYLRRLGIPSQLVVFPEAGHWPSWYEMALYHTAHLEWFHRFLGGASPPWTTEAFANNEVFDFETGKRR